MPWFVKIETGIVPKSEFDRYVPAHKAYVQALIDRGHHAKTGYWGESGGGMMLFQADSLPEAEELCQPIRSFKTVVSLISYTNGGSY